MKDLVVAALLLAGGAFMLLGALGLVRLPDVFTRMQAATKAATLGAACLLAAVAVHFAELGVTSRAVLVIAFLFLTAPVGAHVLARAAYSAGVPLWEGTVRDELREAYRVVPGEVQDPPEPGPAGASR